MLISRPNLVFHFDASSRELRVEDIGSYMTRNQKTSQLLHDAVSSLTRQGTLFTRELHIPIYTGDQSPGDIGKPHFAYTGDGTEPDLVLIPDFSFGGWPECGWPDYEEVVDQLLAASCVEPTDHRLFWIGNTKTHASRQYLVANIAPRDPRVCALNLPWNMRTAQPGKMHDVPRGLKYVSLPQHGRYRYLLDLQGIGYSARMKMLFFSGRPVFVQQRKWIEYWHANLKPFEHYIPVREDLDDLSERIDWADANRTQATEIGRAGQRFAMKELRYVNAVQRMAECLVAVAEGRRC